MAKLPQSTTANTNGDSGKKKEFPVIPNNTMLDVVVERCEVRELDPDFRAKFEIQDTHEVNFMFRVTSGEWERRCLFGSAKPYINDSDTCKLRIWCQELLGVDKLPDGFEFDSDDFIGKSARLLVGEYTKKNGKVDNKIKEVLRVANTSNTDPIFAGEPF